MQVSSQRYLLARNAVLLADGIVSVSEQRAFPMANEAGAKGGLSGLSLGLIVLSPTVIIIVLAICAWCICSKWRSSATHVSAGVEESNSMVANRFSSIWNRPSVSSWLSKRVSRTNSSANKSRRVWLSSACEMTFALLQSATNNFSSSNLLGEGGSSRVYRAQLDDDVIAVVKRLVSNEKRILSEFQSEIELMRQVRHPNLVSLLGFCSHGQERLLVLELMQNGSLEDQLYGPSQGTTLSWNLRIKIALDAARGLEYLHEYCVPPVVHRDFKSSNILLDANYNAKVSDFGLATPLDHLTREESLQLMGTIGYVAPEYFENGTLTEKSDVYGFGVVLLELLTGRKPIDSSLPPEEHSLVAWAMPQLTSRDRLPNLVDKSLRDNLNLKHLYQVSAVAALCVQAEASYRPLIADVVQSLVPLVPVELGGALRPTKSFRGHMEALTSPSNQHSYSLA